VGQLRTHLKTANYKTETIKDTFYKYSGLQLD